MHRIHRCACEGDSRSSTSARPRGGGASKGASKSTHKKETKKKKGKSRKRTGKPRLKQLTIFDGRWGGAREGSGPKPKPGAGVPHDAREQFRNSPVHVTSRIAGPRSLRNAAEAEVLRKAFVAGGHRDDFQIKEYSIEPDHIHLIVEATDEVALAVGMKGLCVRIARALNRLWNRTGAVFTDRYHAHVIRFPKVMRNVLRYVLCNGRKHGVHTAPGPDPFSSGPAYKGWSDRDPELAVPDPCIAEPWTWILTLGIAKCDPIATYEVPRHSTNPRAFATQRKAERRRRRRRSA